MLSNSQLLTEPWEATPPLDCSVENCRVRFGPVESVKRSFNRDPLSSMCAVSKFQAIDTFFSILSSKQLVANAAAASTLSGIVSIMVWTAAFAICRLLK